MATQKPTVAVVRLIVEGDFSDIQVQSVIDDAALMVEACVANYSADRQSAIIRWVTAHLFSMMPEGRFVTSSKLGDASESYSAPKLGDSLAGSPFGQQALMLDTSGCLARIGRAIATVEKV